MLFDFAALERNNFHTEPTGAPEAPFYLDDLLPALQSMLVALADVDIRHEIDLDYLEDWSGADQVKQRLRQAQGAPAQGGRAHG